MYCCVQFQLVVCRASNTYSDGRLQRDYKDVDVYLNVVVLWKRIPYCVSSLLDILLVFSVLEK